MLVYLFLWLADEIGLDCHVRGRPLAALLRVLEGALTSSGVVVSSDIQINLALADQNMLSPALRLFLFEKDRPN